MKFDPQTFVRDVDVNSVKTIDPENVFRAVTSKVKQVYVSYQNIYCCFCCVYPGFR